MTEKESFYRDVLRLLNQSKLMMNNCKDMEGAAELHAAISDVEVWFYYAANPSGFADEFGMSINMEEEYADA